MIDSHVHVWTDDHAAYPRIPSSPNFSPPRFMPEEFFRHAHPCGVRRAVLIQMSFYGFDNSYMVDQMRAHPGAFAGISTVDSSSPDVGVTMKSLAEQGVRGFRIQPGESPRTWLDAPGMQSMWKCGAEEQLAMCPLVNPDALEPLDRMCEKFAETPVVIDHLARIGADGQIRGDDVRQLCALSRHARVFVKVSAFYALGRRLAPYHDVVPFIRRVFDAFGSRRLMWGSDCPFQVQDGHTYASSLELIEEGLPFVSSEDRSWMLERTAESLFFS